MPGTLLKDDLGDYVSDQFNQFVNQVHANDPPPITIPNPLDQISQVAGQAVDTARSAFGDWVDSLPPAPFQQTPTETVPSTGQSPINWQSSAPTAPTENVPSTAQSAPPPPSPFLDWTAQVDSGQLPSPTATVTAPPTTDNVSPAEQTAAFQMPDPLAMLDRSGVVNYVKQRAADFGLDAAAVLAVANQEGLNTDPGSHWKLPGEGNISFGPPSWYGNGAGADIIRQQGDNAAAWSWTPPGLDYWLNQVSGVARGLQGNAAIEAIVNRFERPREDLAAGEIQRAKDVYPQFTGAAGDVLSAAGQSLSQTAQNAAGGVSDVLGASQRLVDQSAQNLASGASQKAQDASSALTDLLYGFRAPLTAAAESTPGRFLGGFVSEAERQNQEAINASLLDQLQHPALLGGYADLGRAVTSGLEAAGVPGHEDTGFAVGPLQVGPREVLGQLANLAIPLGGEAKAVGPAAERAAASVTERLPAELRNFVGSEAGSLDLDALARLREATRAVPQPPLEGASAPLSTGQRVANAVDKFVAYTVSNMLSSPASLFGNATAIAQNVTRPIETAVVAALKAAGGDIPGARTEIGAAGRDLVGQGAAIGDALSTFGRTFAQGMERPVDVRSEAWPGLQGAVATPALRLNAATDELVRALGQAGAQAAEFARLQAQNPGLSAADIADRFAARLNQVGADEAAHVGFQSGGSGVGNVISRWRNQLTRQGATVPERLAGAALHVAVPFSNVPDVILTRGLAGVPGINELVGNVRAARAAIGGDTDAAQRIGAGMFVNSAANLAIYALVQQGIITGNGPDDPARRSAAMNARDANGNPIWRPNSVHIGDRWFNYGGLGPISVRMGVIANAVEQWELEGRKPDATVLSRLGGIASGSLQTVGDMWYLQGLADILDAVKTGNLGGAAGRTVGGVEDRLVPLGGLANSIRQWTDPTVREPQNAAEREFNRLPGLSYLVRPKLDPATGQPIQEPRDVAALMRGTAAGQPNAVDEALRSRNLGVSDAPTTITRGNLTIELTDDEQRRFVESSGPEIARRVTAVIGAHGYDQLTPDQQRSRLETAIRLSRDAATVRLWSSIPADERTRRVAAYRSSQQQRAEPLMIGPGR